MKKFGAYKGVTTNHNKPTQSIPDNTAKNIKSEQTTTNSTASIETTQNSGYIKRINIKDIQNKYSAYVDRHKQLSDMIEDE